MKATSAKWRDYETAGRHRNEPRHVVPARQALLEAGQKRDTGSNGRADRRFLRTVQRAYASTPDAQKKRRLIKWRSERIAALIAQGLDDRETVGRRERLPALIQEAASGQLSRDCPQGAPTTFGARSRDSRPMVCSHATPAAIGCPYRGLGND